MNKQILLIIILILFFIIPCVHADENTTIAFEEGDSNITFTNGYNGYCAEWGEHSAEIGNEFTITNTLNEENSNYIKTFFVYFYDEAQKDTISTQHMIWKFTDNKQFSRFNQTLYEKIIEKGNTVNVPDDGELIINNTTKMVFSFRFFIAQQEEYQNYFGYRIIFKNITKTPEIINNTTKENTTNNTLNIDTTINKTIITNNKIITKKNNYLKTKLNKHKTAKEIIGISCLMLLLILCFSYTIRYEK